MSEYKENSTRRVLNKTNFSIWKQELYLVLEEHDLGDYILEEIIKIISEEDIPEGEDKNNYNPVLGLSIYRYDKTITKEIIKNDVKVKKIILNSIIYKYIVIYIYIILLKELIISYYIYKYIVIYIYI